MNLDETKRSNAAIRHTINGTTRRAWKGLGRTLASEAIVPIRPMMDKTAERGRDFIGDGNKVPGEVRA